MTDKINTSEIEKKIGYKFRDKGLLLQALTRTSFVNEHKCGGTSPYQSNEVLEFFGDSILSASIVTLFIKEFSLRYEHGVRTKLGEGDFTVIRSRLTDKKNLSSRALELGLGEYLRMGEGDAKLGIKNEPSVLEDVFESIIGAVYIDSNMDLDTVNRVVAGMLDISRVVNADSKSATPNAKRSAKNRLQEWCADKKRRLPAPVYKTVAESGPEHKKTYERACYIGDVLYATGSGKNLKEADACAAEETLKMLEDAEGRVKKKSDPLLEDAIIKLREYAKSKKVTSPAFRDMGETERSVSGAREYAVMCSFQGVEEIGVAKDKSTARTLAARRVFSRLGGQKEKRDATKKDVKEAPRVKKMKKKNNDSVLRKGKK